MIKKCNGSIIYFIRNKVFFTRLQVGKVIICSSYNCFRKKQRKEHAKFNVCSDWIRVINAIYCFSSLDSSFTSSQNNTDSLFKTLL